MMTFTQINATTSVSTNSIKKVEIEIFPAYVDQDGNFDRVEYMVYTPEGRLLDNATVSGPFESFEAAKRDAEMNVGMKMFGKMV